MGVNMKDAFGRKIDYMRVSIIDRCNLRCRYCMPYEIDKVSHWDLLSYEELLRVIKGASKLGISKIKITGGEPLVRRGCMEFIGQVKQIPGIEKVTITTNGILLQENLQAMKEINLDGINISLDTLQRKRYIQIAGKDEFDTVWAAVLKAAHTGLKVKINCVPLKGFNEDEFLDFAMLTEKYPIDVRFIEMMPIGYGKQFSPVKGSAIIEYLTHEMPDLQPTSEERGNGPARYYKSSQMKGCVGFIDAVNHKFCHSCNRIRLTSEGFLKLCLYYNHGIDLRSLMRSGAKEQELMDAICRTIYEKPMEHQFQKFDSSDTPRKPSDIINQGNEFTDPSNKNKLVEEKGMCQIGG